jgi:hypothetical protein
MLAARAVASLLGMLTFGCGAGSLSPPPGVDSLGTLQRATAAGELAVTVPWVLSFFRFLPWDAEAATAACYLEPLAALRRMLASPRLRPSCRSPQFATPQMTLRAALTAGLTAQSPTTPTACTAFAAAAGAVEAGGVTSRAAPPPPPPLAALSHLPATQWNLGLPPDRQVRPNSALQPRTTERRASSARTSRGNEVQGAWSEAEDDNTTVDAAAEENSVEEERIIGDARDPLHAWGATTVGEGEEVPADLSKGGLDGRYVESMCPVLDAAITELLSANESARRKTTAKDASHWTTAETETSHWAVDASAASISQSSAAVAGATALPRRVMAVRTRPIPADQYKTSAAGPHNITTTGLGSAAPSATCSSNLPEASCPQPPGGTHGGTQWPSTQPGISQSSEPGMLTGAVTAAAGGGIGGAWELASSPGRPAGRPSAQPQSAAAVNLRVKQALQRSFLSQRPALHRVVDFAVESATLAAADAASAAAMGPAVRGAHAAVSHAAVAAAAAAPPGAQLEDAWTPSFEHAVECAALAAARHALGPAAAAAAIDASSRAAGAVAALITPSPSSSDSVPVVYPDASISRQSAAVGATSAAAAAVAADVAHAAAADRVRRTLPFELHSQIQSEARAQLKKALAAVRDAHRSALIAAEAGSADTMEAMEDIALQANQVSSSSARISRPTGPAGKAADLVASCRALEVAAAEFLAATAAAAAAPSAATSSVTSSAAFPGTHADETAISRRLASALADTCACIFSLFEDGGNDNGVTVRGEGGHRQAITDTRSPPLLPDACVLAAQALSAMLYTPPIGHLGTRSSSSNGVSLANGSSGGLPLASGRQSSATQPISDGGRGRGAKGSGSRGDTSASCHDRVNIEWLGMSRDGLWDTAASAISSGWRAAAAAAAVAATTATSDRTSDASVDSHWTPDASLSPHSQSAGAVVGSAGAADTVSEAREGGGGDTRTASGSSTPVAASTVAAVDPRWISGATSTAVGSAAATATVVTARSMGGECAAAFLAPRRWLPALAAHPSAPFTQRRAEVYTRIPTLKITTHTSAHKPLSKSCIPNPTP